jgi:hypothetical protein
LLLAADEADQMVRCDRSTHWHRRLGLQFQFRRLLESGADLRSSLPTVLTSIPRPDGVIWLLET